MGHISVRESIRWLPDSASEPTSTIVLTSPGRLFVDLRFYKSDDGSSSDLESGQVLPPSRLEWAIAGHSAPPPSPDPVDKHWRGKWAHWIDSRTIDSQGVVDEGDMYPLPPPDEHKVLEKGRMTNPLTGVETDYEEVWFSEEIVAVGGTGCVVLQLEDEERKRWGRVVRLGQYCQGFGRFGEEVVVERWKWEEGGWEMKVKIGGAVEIPTDFVTGFGHEAELGDEVKVGGDVWKVIEKS